MKGKEKYIENRKVFVETAINNPAEGACILRKIADELESVRNTMQAVHCLENILHLSERTILRDLKG